MDLGRFRIGLRVPDVEAAAARYRGLGFDDVGSVPGPSGTAVMIMLQCDGAMLIVDALVGMPFASTERETTVQQGPRGLGVAIGIAVDDLLATYRWVESNGFQITTEPYRAPFGDDIFECIDPDGYLWEISRTAVADLPADGAVAATRNVWFGDTAPPPSELS